MTAQNQIKIPTSTLTQSMTDLCYNFGMFKPRTRLDDDSRLKHPILYDAIAYAEEIVKNLDKRLQDETPEYKQEFLSYIKRDLAAIIAGIQESLGDGYHNFRRGKRTTRAEMPKYFYEDDEDAYDGKRLGVDVGLFDHFSKRNGEYVSHPYGLSWGEIVDAVEWAKKRGISIHIDAGSNYYPTRTLELRFRKIGEKK